MKIKKNRIFLKKLILSVWAIYYFSLGTIFFKIYRRTPKKSYLAMRKLYILTNGRFNDSINYLIGLIHPKRKNIETNGILGKLDEFEIRNITQKIKQNGYYVHNQKINQETIDKVIDFAFREPSSPRKLNNQISSLEKVIFSKCEGYSSPIYAFEMEQIFTDSTLLKLALDQSLLAVAQEYLNCEPVLDLVSLWWSVPFDKKGTSEAAQEFHFDMDHIKFLKIFIYMTDVNTNNGPHCYVSNSHKRKPVELLSDGRKSDEQISEYYPNSSIHELCASSGTIIFSDTRGFHKGKPLLEGKRLIFQVEYANSLFGQNYKKPHINFESINSNWYSQQLNFLSRTYELLRSKDFNTKKNMT